MSGLVFMLVLTTAACANAECRADEDAKVLVLRANANAALMYCYEPRRAVFVLLRDLCFTVLYVKVLGFEVCDNV